MKLLIKMQHYLSFYEQIDYDDQIVSENLIKYSKKKFEISINLLC